jgi:hypothetical protein
MLSPRNRMHPTHIKVLDYVECYMVFRILLGILQQLQNICGYRDHPCYMGDRGNFIL